MDQLKILVCGLGGGERCWRKWLANLPLREQGNTTKSQKSGIAWYTILKILYIYFLLLEYNRYIDSNDNADWSYFLFKKVKNILPFNDIIHIIYHLPQHKQRGLTPLSNLYSYKYWFSFISLNASKYSVQLFFLRILQCTKIEFPVDQNPTEKGIFDARDTSWFSFIFSVVFFAHNMQKFGKSNWNSFQYYIIFFPLLSVH